MLNSPPLVAAVVYEGMNLFELGVVAEVFGGERPDFEQPLFRLKFAQAEPGPLRAVGGLQLRTHGGLAVLRSADIVVIPGWRDPRSEVPRPLKNALAAAHARGARLVSVCAGSFVLAATGLLDGRRATTHWRYADLFRERFPRVVFDPDVLYVDGDALMTSAGSAAGIDACLQVVRQCYGADVANTVARAMVTSPHRNGGQAQYIAQPFPVRTGRSLAPLLEWARQHLAEAITVTTLAERGAMSDRTLLRRFIAEVGIAPKAWLQNERIMAAQRLLESTASSHQSVAQAVGFATLGAFRKSFMQSTGLSAAAYRERFRA